MCVCWPFLPVSILRLRLIVLTFAFNCFNFPLRIAKLNATIVHPVPVLLARQRVTNAIFEVPVCAFLLCELSAADRVREFNIEGMSCHFCPRSAGLCGAVISVYAPPI